ncbi:MAG: nuclear transport factor 2 family protein [Actinobacteria bacterium]|nr:nuclear transport factor 2 family protein [Actinomycetota bacterium]
MDERSVKQWAGAYAQAWERSDPDAVVALFTTDASYRSLIFAEPHMGQEEIRAYWERATASQDEARVSMGDPLVDGRRAAVEWWTVMKEEDEGWITLPGCLLLEFEGDRCARLSEYWHLDHAAVEPYEGWGRIEGGGDTRTTRAAAERWTEAWKAGWETVDANPIVATYNAEALYRSSPLRAPESGGVASYLSRCFPDENNVTSRFDVWAASGSYALTIYNAALDDTAEGGEVTIAGCDVLRFSEEGLCVEQRDYWNICPGRLPNHSAWPD